MTEIEEVIQRSMAPMAPMMQASLIGTVAGAVASWLEAAERAGRLNEPQLQEECVLRAKKMLTKLPATGEE